LVPVGKILTVSVLRHKVEKIRISFGDEMKEDQIKEGINFQIAGWILFVICAVFFIASSLKNHDTLTFIGSVIFLIACIVFLIPIFRTYKIAENITEQNDDK
jgi:uncharacterized Tic20 family protein